jgi:hypothetical protein
MAKMAFFNQNNIRFNKKRHFFAENMRKSLKSVIAILTPEAAKK